MADSRRSCPECGASYPSNSEYCSLDGTALSEIDVDSLVGRTIGRYEIIERIGEGGMARLYRARHTYLKQDFAVKILFGDLAASGLLVNRFHREAQAVSQIKHVNVVQTVDFGKTDEGLSFMVMEYIDGITLSQFMRQQNPLPLARIAVIIKQIAQGLGAAHALGFVHRDLKPGNIMIQDRPEGLVAKVLDFGLVHLEDPGDDDISKLTQAGQILGTPTYMAPEQISAAEISPKTDLYALGIVLYELLLGQPPFQGNMASVMNQHLFEPAPAIPSIGGLEQLAAELLEKAPEQRPSSAEAVAQRLEALETKGFSTADQSSREQSFEGQSFKTTKDERPADTKTDAQDQDAFGLDITPEKSKNLVFLAVAVSLLMAAGVFFTQQRKQEGAPAVTALAPAPKLPNVKIAKATSPDSKAKKPNKPIRRPKSSARSNNKTAPKSKRTKAKEESTLKNKTPSPRAAKAQKKPQAERRNPKVEKREAPAKPKKPAKIEETQTTVEVEFEAPTPSKRPKSNEDSMSTIAAAHRKSAKRQPHDPALLKRKLEALRQSSENTKSKSDKEKAVEFKQSAIKAISEKRSVWAEIQLGRCLDLDRKNSDCNKLLALVRHRKGDDLAAIKYYLLYLKYTPQAPDRKHILDTVAEIRKKQ